MCLTRSWESQGFLDYIRTEWNIQGNALFSYASPPYDMKCFGVYIILIAI